MWRVILTFAVCLVCLFLTRAQTVIENESSIVLNEKTADISLAIENQKTEFNSSISLELLDPESVIRTNMSSPQRIKSGKDVYKLSLPLGDLLEKNQTDISWYRLRYQVGETRGIISISELLEDVFEIKSFAGYVVEESRYRVSVQAFNPLNDERVEAVNVEGEIKIEDGETVRATGKTKGKGFAVLEFKLPKFTQNSDLDLTLKASKNGVTRTVSEELPNRTFRHAVLQTDKPIYQPNQNLNLRLFYINSLNKPVANAELDIEIESQNEDDDDETVFRDKITTSRFGLANVVWNIPESAKLGNYDIEIRDRNNDVIGYERIKITRYELPNFYVETEPDRKFYLPEQRKAKIEVNAQYLFGKPVESAKVRIVSDGKDMAEIVGTTDEKGKFIAEIDLEKAHEEFKSSGWTKFEDLRFTAYITDPTNNRTEQRRFDLRVTKESIHVYLIGDTYRQSQLLPLKYYVSAFYADGTPAVCEVEVFERIEKDLDGNTIPAELGKQFAKAKTNQYGVARLNLPLQIEKNEELKIKIIAKDKNKQTGSTTSEIETTNAPAIKVETDKMIYQRGEPIRVSITSSKRKGTIYLDLMKKYEALQNHQLKLNNGRAEIILPFDENIKNDVTLYVYFADEADDIVFAKKTVVFPTPNNLKIEAKVKNAEFRPGQEANIRFQTVSGAQKPTETALGVLLLDKALEERARSESEFGRENGFLNRNFTSSFNDLLGFNKVFGKFSRYDIENLDMSKGIDKDLELAVEVAYRKGDYFVPKIMRSESLRSEVERVYDPFFKKQIAPIREMLGRIYNEKGLIPIDEKIWREILQNQGINLENLRDPWGNPLQAEFRYERSRLTFELWSPGADKIAKTYDDLTVYENIYGYFHPTGKIIDSAITEYNQRTRNFVTTYQTLRDEMLRKNIDLDKLRDPWGNPYRFEFLINRTNFIISIKTDGANGKPEEFSSYQSDDAEVWSHSADYFAYTRAKVKESFEKYVTETKNIPNSEAELKIALRENGFDLDKNTDVYGRPYYVKTKKDYDIARIYRAEGNELKAIKVLLFTYSIKSAGSDGVRENYDDFELFSFEGASKEEEVSINESERDFSNARRILKQSTTTTPEGAIGGTVMDLNGAIIPNADAIVKNFTGTFNRTVKSNDAGYFLFQNLPKGVYQLQVYAPGFQSTYISNIPISPSTLTEIDVVLEVGNVTSTVDVSSDSVVLETTNSSVSIAVRREVPRAVNQPNFTPRVREYFPETLVWQPELITDKRGNAEVKFKFADSLTTWKLYAIGSTVSGELGVVEKELKTFQPFFAELDPPKVLTEGDEIALPITVRNYTKKKQNVTVTMTENNWSKMLNGNLQQVEILPDKFANAIFNFRAVTPVKDGKQRVTVSAPKEADAIEKSVTVRPNGFETKENQSQLFNESAVFKVNFPANAFPDSKQATLKIYPNLLSHVAESVNGLLKRPYGCGEQTLSSTYPNLLSLKVHGKFKNVDESLLKTAKSYLQDSYKRMLNYQTKEGGYSYWGSNPDIPLTAYALRFLSDAEDFIEVDENVTERMQEWLLSQQSENGSWKNDEMITAYVVRSLSLNEAKDKDVQTALQKGLGFLQKSAEKSNENYVLANIALASDKLGDKETAKSIARKLGGFAQPSSEGMFWKSQKTPFYGWGKTADIETTALVLQAILPYSEEKEINSVLARGLSYLIKNKDGYGVWYSTQTTVNVLDTLTLIQSKTQTNAKNEKTAIFVNGKKVNEFLLDEKGLANPFILDVSPYLEANENTIEIKSVNNSSLTMAQIVATHFSDWKDAKLNSSYFSLKISYDKTIAKIGEEITCAVEIERKNNVYGMILAEIGIPPGADVDRNSLEKARTASNLSNYDILPDKIVLYFWSGKEKKEFSFRFKPRYGINALSAVSIVYDYYNPEANAVFAPIKFEVK